MRCLLRLPDEEKAPISIIADTPELARLRYEVSPPVRIHTVESHVIVYLTDACGVRILRIRPHRENWSARPY
ncbi:type II toxin-antitoxin system RelE/ParE family toxin [Epibacterium ulvae]|uniref:type II toxin-antitoxin system RelE/ParE family toxin n=1 Tax=Epibacterium ulvae TaxID=1156985 RepID=UPI002490A3FE|nr:type II toxin-antitoxin system RelE/ParE family toxin [Epibacterium ulvae]